MPSFRAVLQIKGLLPGHQPQAVMSTAVAALGSIHLVEANSLDVVAGVPVITLRFLVEASTDEDENLRASDASAKLRSAIEEIAITGRLTTLRRERGKWLFVS
ncbi:hypothetical protein RSal33209_0080 [Renibacterium salmoninarum ATCC 33209]|uniref:Uncharacterized protein n=1 Tax=Renibacterium salmoninarum (strain ATCC 33209 / DSM 20767 / JCM 11484 / NBRC 15589 / NCIMB 2235) TaxID=288705 RepID=A9WLQ6_RENSM|nr:hypothetical protein [Renibacterium salmoninarum]ABY21836.1 hypothetical protein RSal33209_0080 [Renibacterium salmoninarum ATCC 33209]